VALMLLPPAVAAADDNVASQHNITYRARVDGIARGALISYRISDRQINSANPTMLPGRIFETTGVLTDPKEAGMRISIQWPYSAYLHCEILVDDQLVVQASQFIGPRLTPATDDPDFGAIICGAPLTNVFGAPAAVPPGDAVQAVPPTDAAPALPGQPLPPMLPGEGPPLDSLPVDILPVAPPTITPQTDPSLPIT
jgi:hypothetical protein